MRVLALVTDAFGGYGGIAQYNRDLAGALASTPAIEEVEVLARYAPEATGQLPDKVVQHPAEPHRTRLSLRAFELAARKRPDLVFCGHLHLGPLAAAIAKAWRCRLLVQTHGVEVWTKPSDVRRRSLEAADGVLSVSRDTRARVLNWADLTPERIRVVPNTFAADFSPGDRAAARARLRVGDAKVILSVSRLDGGQRHKGQDRVIRALPHLRAHGMDVIYVVAGVGDDLPRLQVLAAAEGVADCVRFVGKVPLQDLPDLYRAADLFALPSTGDGFGIVFLEAMACGTPALGLAAGGAVDALAEGRLGLAVEERELVPALAAALETQGPDPQSLSARVESRFGRESFKHRIAAAIEAVMA